MRTPKLLAAALALGPCTALLAATDGTLTTGGGVSEGSSDIGLVKQVSVQITGLDDLALGSFAALDEAVTVTDEVCVFTTGVDFLVEASSTSGAFALVGESSGHRLPYTVRWGEETLATGSGGGGGGSFLDNVPGILGAPPGGATDTALSSVQSLAGTGCEGEGNASYSITIAAEDFNAAPHDDYTDTMTLSIAPE